MSLQRAYTKSQLEALIFSQLENLNEMNDLISMMRHQNELLKKANKKLKEEITDFKRVSNKISYGKKADSLVPIPIKEKNRALHPVFSS